METLRYEIEFITPAFIGGAMKKNLGDREITVAELRPASFIGLLRWWWRALNSIDDPNVLYTKEASLFGGAENKGKPQSSKVWIRIKCPREIDKGRDIKEDFNLKWYFNNQERTLEGKHKGIGYLLSILKGREYIKPGFRFILEILGNDEEALKQTVASLWTFIFLGGIGNRARRGGGNMACIKVEPKIDYINLNFNPNEHLDKWLRDNLRKAISIVGGYKDPKASLDYPSLYGSRILVSESSSKTWEEALNDVGKIYMDYRRNNRHRIFDMACFGFPIIHTSNKTIVKGLHHERRASPLIFRVIKISEGVYKWVVVKLSGRFLPGDEKLGQFKGKNVLRKDFPTCDCLDEFIDMLCEKGRCREVLL